MYPDLSLDPMAEKTSLVCYIESHTALLIGGLESPGSISQECVLLNITLSFDIICHEGRSPIGFCRMGITPFKISPQTGLPFTAITFSVLSSGFYSMSKPEALWA